MTDDATELPPELPALDPVLGDPPPLAGSSRYESILERAMTTTESLSDEHSSATPARRVWPMRVLVAAAAVVVLAVGVIVVGPFGKTKPASATEQIAAAAKKTGDVTKLRVHGVYTDHFTDGSNTVTTLDAEVDGTDIDMRFSRASRADRPGSSSSFTVIDDRSWETENGHTTEKPAGPLSERNAPFPIASRAVVSAALTGSVVNDLGKEKVRDVQTTHFKITLTDVARKALGALPANELSAFELEYPQNVKTFEVWVADGLIHRISIVNFNGGYGSDQHAASGPGSATENDRSKSVVEFYDFGAAITITPPK